MKYLTTNEIREMWLKFWKSKDHLELESKSLIPYNDNSLLFINSGVATLKSYLSGLETPPSTRIVNSQRSLRTNDIENVGVTARHHTLFEMLGNFSIGDYFKKEAIAYAWELITDKKYFNLDIDKIYITVHPHDKESYKYWLEVGVAEDKIIKTYENFWEIGRGPGGPNTEIFFDRGEKYDDRDPVELLQEDLETDRVVEIWNIVFSQYNCNPDIPQEEYEELPQKNIDTGMGLERMACILQEVQTNFETDNFKIIMNEIANITNTKYEDYKKPYRVIADHIRALTFAISDGVDPSNEGRGYVLRRLIRRAVKYGYIDLNITEPFLYKLIPAVVKQMSEYYPYLEKEKSLVEKIIKVEEERFLQTIKDGFKYFDSYLEEVANNDFPADKAFMLYDTYGFPIELTCELLEEKNINLNLDEYNKYLEEQRTRAREARKDISSIAVQDGFMSNIEVESEFVGYDTLKVNTKVVFITDGKEKLTKLSSGEEGYIILEKTPFYAKSGGQEADQGKSENFEVLDVIKLPLGQHLHKVKVVKEIKLLDQVEVEVDQEMRNATCKNHSATHLLHYALVKVLGEEVKQAGSFQDSFKTRFDFTYHKEITKEELDQIQDIVNENIKLSQETSINIMDIESAKDKGAKALFGEKYGDEVRVVNIGPSLELCGGTHIANTKQIQMFYIKSEQSIGSGIHRIEALTATNVLKYQEEIKKLLLEEIKTKEESLNNKKLIKLDEVDKYLNILLKLNKVNTIDLSSYENLIKKLEENNERLKISLEEDNKNTIDNLVENLINTKVEENGIFKIEQEIEGISNKELKNLADLLLNQLGQGYIILKLREGDKLSIVVKVSDDITDKYNAGKIIKEILEPLGGRGGGKPNMAQGGATIK